jgi:glycosyltransferase involved in cell wall biosynthesis
MNVVVETSALYTSSAGVARYVRGLLGGLRRTAPAEVQVRELAWAVENLDYRQPRRALKTMAREWGWAQWVAPWRARGADVLHHTGVPVIPFFGPTRHVVTLHDLALLRQPERFRPWQRRTGLRRLRRLARATRIICVSRFTAAEARELLGLEARRLEVVYHGGAWDAGTAPRPPAEFQPPPEYLLFVGSLEPGKNLRLLGAIYRDARARGAALPPLVVVGTRWAGVPHEGPSPEGWIFAGYQPDDVLAWLYHHARLLAFPSRYEGFGFPVLEAMSLGCPVVCGRVASLPEIAGDAAAFADLNPEAFGGAIRRVLAEDEWREELRALGRRRAAAFTWERCARETCAVYAAAVAG